MKKKRLPVQPNLVKEDSFHINQFPQNSDYNGKAVTKFKKQIKRNMEKQSLEVIQTE